jgi:hypothetical protein
VEHLFIGKDLAMGHEMNTLFRHTIDTPQVATVSDGKTKIIDEPVMVVQQWPAPNEIEMKFTRGLPIKKTGKSLVSERRCLLHEQSLQAIQSDGVGLNGDPHPVRILQELLPFGIGRINQASVNISPNSHNLALFDSVIHQDLPACLL